MIDMKCMKKKAVVFSAYRSMCRFNGSKQLVWLRTILEQVTQRKEKVLLFCHFLLNPECNHSPYTADKIAREGNTTFINIACGTGASGSIVMDFTEGASAIQIRRRDHDNEIYMRAYDVSVPLRTPCRLDPVGLPASSAE